MTSPNQSKLLAALEANWEAELGRPSYVRGPVGEGG